MWEAYWANERDMRTTAELAVSFEDVSTASYRIRKGILETSCKYSPLLSKRMGYELFLKKDYRQMTGRWVSDRR